MFLLDAPLLNALTMSSSLAYIPLSQSLSREPRDLYQAALVIVKRAEGYLETRLCLACLLPSMLFAPVHFSLTLIRANMDSRQCERWLVCLPFLFGVQCSRKEVAGSLEMINWYYMRKQEFLTKHSLNM